MNILSQYNILTVNQYPFWFTCRLRQGLHIFNTRALPTHNIIGISAQPQSKPNLCDRNDYVNSSPDCSENKLMYQCGDVPM